MSDILKEVRIGSEVYILRDFTGHGKEGRAVCTSKHSDHIGFKMLTGVGNHIEFFAEPREFTILNR